MSRRERDRRTRQTALSCPASRLTLLAASPMCNTLAAAVAGALALLAPVAGAQTWRFETSLGLQETLTNNVKLDPKEIRESDLVTQITPTLRVSERGARTSLDGFVSVPILLYVRTGAENNQVYPSVDLRGTAELARRLLFVDGRVSVAQLFYSPFGAQPVGLDTATQNRYQSATYSISPYLKGVAFGKVDYELRNTNSWNNLSGAPFASDNSHTTQWTGTASNLQARLGWQANFDITDTKFNDQNTIRTRLVRFVPVYTVDAPLRLKASIGYEDNEYALTQSNGVIYGVGFEWRPSPRTQVVGNWEQRFFGPSYLFSFDHRTPLSVWNVRFSRNITTYPQQVASLPPGVFLPGLLDGLFLPTYPDPAERARAVEQFLQNRGLPTTLSSPVSLYSQQILLQQSATATAGLIGARNTLFLSLYNVDTEQIAGSGEALPPAFTFGNNVRQSGASLTWTHNVTSLVVLSARASGYRAVYKAPYEGTTNQGGVTVQLSSPLSGKTNAFVGARYQSLSTTVGSNYREAAAFVGINHSFR